MTVAIAARVDAIKPNAFDDNAKLAWLNGWREISRYRIHGLSRMTACSFGERSAAVLITAPVLRRCG